MIRSVRIFFIEALLVVIGALLFAAALGLVYRIGHASAAVPGSGAIPSAAPATDPGSLIGGFYDAIRTGRGTVAIGIALMLVVWAFRSGLGSRWAWFKSPIGGYALGFALPAIVYVGSALYASQPLTASLVVNAIGAGWVAAGGWQHLQDAIEKMRAKPAAGGAP